MGNVLCTVALIQGLSCVSRMTMRSRDSSKYVCIHPPSSYSSTLTKVLPSVAILSPICCKFSPRSSARPNKLRRYSLRP
jgi:hypothetical protein